MGKSRMRRMEEGLGKSKRRQIEKALKKLKSVSKKLETLNVSGYSNDSNPFGDSNLSKKFIWVKKIGKDVMRGVSLDQFTLSAERKRQRERMEEIEHMKKRREERVLQKSTREEDIMVLHRERVRADAVDFEKKDNIFCVEQISIKSQIRILEGRAKLIDVFIHCIVEDKSKLLHVNPHINFKCLTMKEMEELRDVIKLQLDLDRAHAKYWKALVVICEELVEARRKGATAEASVQSELPLAQLLADQEQHGSIRTDVKELLDGKTHQDLVEIQAEIESRMHSGEAKVVEFWVDVLRCIHLYKAKAFLKEIHPEMWRHLQCLLNQPHQVENLSSDQEEVGNQQVLTLNPWFIRAMAQRSQSILPVYIQVMTGASTIIHIMTMITFLLRWLKAISSTFSILILLKKPRFRFTSLRKMGRVLRLA